MPTGLAVQLLNHSDKMSKKSMAGLEPATLRLEVLRASIAPHGHREYTFIYSIYMDDYIVVKCPHCDSFIFIFKKELNCKIFRHGVYKDTLKQINPHMNKVDCDNLVKNSEILGCAKPFTIVFAHEKYHAEKCDYI